MVLVQVDLNQPSGCRRRSQRLTSTPEDAHLRSLDIHFDEHPLPDKTGAAYYGVQGRDRHGCLDDTPTSSARCSGSDAQPEAWKNDASLV